MCVPLLIAAERLCSTTSDHAPSCCYHGGCLFDDEPPRSSVYRRRRLTATASTAIDDPCAVGPQRNASRSRRLHRSRYVPYPPPPPPPPPQPSEVSSSESPAADPAPMFKQGFPPGRMAAGADQTASSVPLPPPPPVASPAFNLQFNQQVPSGFSGFMSEHHNYYNHQFPYTFSSASPPTYSWANTNSTDIMKFTGQSNPRPLDTSTYHLSNFGSVPKRKIDLEYELPQPPKIRITEEKVSASLRDMHISNTFKPHNYCATSANTNVSDMDNMIIEDASPSNVINVNKLTKTESKTTLVMCEELRKLNKIDSIIPQPLLHVGRPTNALVVWKPQPVIELARSFNNYSQEPKSTVVITEITDEENELNNEDVMFVEDDNTIAVEDDDMEL